MKPFMQDNLLAQNGPVSQGTSPGMPPPGMTQQATPQGLPHDIAEIIPYNTPWYYYAVAVLAVLLLVLTCYLVYKFISNKINNKPKVIIPIDPWETLLSDLKKVIPVEPFAKQSQVEYYYRLSLLLRQAIEYRTQVRATDLTFQELKVPLDKKLPFKTDDRLALINFLEKADYIKFAESEASLDEAQESRDQVKVWVKRLRPNEDLGGSHAIR